MAYMMQAGRDWVRFIWDHPANADDRSGALRRAVAYQVAARLTGRNGLGRVGSRGRVVVRLHDNGASQAIYANPADYAEMMWWRDQLSAGDLFLDVGANIGLYSLWAADHGAEVWAFEPDQEARTRLQENFDLSGMEIRVHDCALGAERGEVTFSSGLGTGNRLMSPGVETSTTVEMRTLDECLSGRFAKGVKVDVEGAEKLVLAGASQALAEQRIETLQLEWNRMSEVMSGEGREPVLEILQQHGYVPFRPVNGQAVPLGRAALAEYGSDVFAASPTFADRLGLVL